MRLLADDVVFQSPVVHTPQRGKAITTQYLAAALQVLNNESFTYLNEWIGETSAVLEFQSVIDGIEINGVDIIAWNAAGKITHFKVMVRPLKAINLLHQMMGALRRVDRDPIPGGDSVRGEDPWGWQVCACSARVALACGRSGVRPHSPRSRSASRCRSRSRQPSASSARTVSIT